MAGDCEYGLALLLEAADSMALSQDELASIARSAGECWEKAVTMRAEATLDSEAARKLLAEMKDIAGRAEKARLVRTAKELRDAAGELSAKLRLYRDPGK